MNSYEIWRKRTLAIVKTQRISISGLEYLPPSGAAILAPNHINWKDIFFLSAIIPRQIHFIGAYELFDKRRCFKYVYDYMIQEIGNWFKIPSEFISHSLASIISNRMREVGAIPVKRGGLVKEMFKSVENSLKKEQLVGVFPEGGSNMTGKLKNFKRGLSKIVYDLWREGYENISVLPAAIKGTEKIFMPNRSLSLKIGSPLFIENHIKESSKETMILFTERLWDAVHRLLSEN